MKHLIPFVKRFKKLCHRTYGFSTAQDPLPYPLLLRQAQHKLQRARE